MATTYKTLPDGNVLVYIPIRLVRKAGLRLVADEPGANMDRNLEMANIQAVANGLKYRRIALTDEFESRFKMAKHFGFDSSYLTRMIRLGYLSPAIVERIARGDLTRFSIQRLQQIQTPIWAEQHKELGIE